MRSQPSTQVPAPAQRPSPGQRDSQKTFPPGFPRLAAIAILFLCLPGAPFPAASLAIGMRDDVPAADYLALANNEAPFPPGKFPDFLPVAAVGTLGRDGEFEIVGSGTLIAPEWVLTAAHVALSGKRGQDFESNLEVRFGPRARAPRSRHRVTGVATPLPPSALRSLLRTGPKVSESEVIHAEFHDLALLHLATPVPDITPSPLEASAEPLAGKRIFIAGYGDAATGNNPKARTWTQADLKRAAENRVDREIARNPYNPRTVGAILLFDFDNGTEERNSLNRRSKSWEHLFGQGKSEAAPTPMEGASYPGDSGGPAFAQSSKGDWAVVGISGYGTGFPPDRRRTSIQYGEILVYTRVSPHLDWIRSHLAPPNPAPPSASVSRAGPAAEVGAPDASSRVTATASPVSAEAPPPIFRPPPAPPAPGPMAH